MTRLLKAMLAGLAAAALTAAPSAAQPAEPDQGLTLEAMAAPALLPGQCALFLWSRAPGERDRALLAVVSEAPAFVRVQAGGRIMDLPAAASGAQSFARPPFALSLRWARGAAAGEMRNGLVRLTGPRGWEAVTPVSGRRVCAPR